MRLYNASWWLLAGLLFWSSGPSTTWAHEARCSDDAAAEPLLVDLNTANATELQRLPRIGPARAHAIVRARERLKGFKRISQLLRVKGIGRATLRTLRPHVTLAAPYAPNRSGTAPPNPLR